MHGQSGGRSSGYVSMRVPIECMGTAVEGVLSMEVRGFTENARAERWKEFWVCRYGGSSRIHRQNGRSKSLPL